MNRQKVSKQIKRELQNIEGTIPIHDLSERLGLSGSQDYPKFVQLIAQLERNQDIIIHQDGTVSSPNLKKTIVGKFTQNRKGFGFVNISDQEDDIFISKSHTNGALDGDEVEVEILYVPHTNENKQEGEIKRIIKRHLSSVIGEFIPYSDKKKADTNLIGNVRIQNKGLEGMTCSISSNGLHPVETEMVVVDITQYPTKDSPFNMEGIAIRSIGYKNDPGTDILTILTMFDIPTTFSNECIEEANRISEKIEADEIAKRMDFRDLLTITIDGASAKDLDDAISLQQNDRGNWLLGVHIADVSYYVTEHTALDQQAYERGTSVYLTDRVVPMLPQRLSNGICSLHPKVDRLTMSCVMEIDSVGEVINATIGPSIIRSDYRMTYDDVNAILEEKDEHLIEKFDEIFPLLKSCETLHHQLLAKRKNRGAIDFDTPEAVIEVDEEGHPINISLRHRGVGEKMIESFMLIANESVARQYTQNHLPFVYRIHESPKEERLENFIRFARSVGVPVSKTDGKLTPKDLQQILSDSEGEPYEGAIRMMMLRSMEQARYGSDPIGHYGLALEDYTHFTSPIRRYPDLMVHRLIRQYQKHKPAITEKSESLSFLDEVCSHASKMERRSVEAERETESLKKTEFMLDKVGETFQAYVSSVTNFGLFVQLDNLVEGLVHISTMNDDYYNFIENHLVLIGERTGATYRIGDKVAVQLVQADLETRQLDFKLIVEKKEDQSSLNRNKTQDKRQAKGRNHKKKSRRKRHSKKINFKIKKKDGRKGRSR